MTCVCCALPTHLRNGQNGQTDSARQVCVTSGCRHRPIGLNNKVFGSILFLSVSTMKVK
jgi:hypothetical protein